MDDCSSDTVAILKYIVYASVCYKINPLSPSDAYMRRQPRPSLVQIMACHLFGAKLLSEPEMEYC